MESSTALIRHIIPGKVPCYCRNTSGPPDSASFTTGHKKMASYLHRTATTTYPCCVPTLGDSAGAGRVGLAKYKYTTLLIFGQYFYILKLFK